jgi:DNA primase
MSAHEVNQLNNSSQVTREERERINYKAHVKTFYEEKVKPNLEKLKTYYEQRGLEKEVRGRDVGFER